MHKSKKYAIAICDGKHVLLGRKQSRIVELVLKHEALSYSSLSARIRIDVDHLYVVSHRLTKAGILGRNDEGDLIVLPHVSFTHVYVVS